MSYSNAQAESALVFASRSWWIVLVFGIFAVLFGLTAIFKPFEIAIVFSLAFGILALAEGVVGLVALIKGSGSMPKGWLAFYSLISLVFGILVIIQPLALVGMMVIFMAIWLMLAGIFRIVMSLRQGKKKEWLLLLSGILAIVLGGLFMFWPAATIAVMTTWVGILALIYGVFQIVAAFRIRKIAKA